MAAQLTPWLPDLDRLKLDNTPFYDILVTGKPKPATSLNSSRRDRTHTLSNTMKNKSAHKFNDLTSEQFREYTFPVSAKGGVVKVRIDAPTHLAVSESGGHRILDAAGMSHYVPAGWVHLAWKAKPGKPNFDF